MAEDKKKTLPQGITLRKDGRYQARYTFNGKRYTILSLTVSRLKNRCIPCVFWVTAIFAVVTKYSNLFFPFTFFLNGSHAAFGYELIICSETTDFMEIIRDKLSSV